MLKKRSELSDYELLLEVFKDNDIEFEPIIPKDKNEIIDYFEIINEDGSKSRLYGDPTELLLSCDGFFCPKYEYEATLKSTNENIINVPCTYNPVKLVQSKAYSDNKCNKDADLCAAA